MSQPMITVSHPGEPVDFSRVEVQASKEVERLLRRQGIQLAVRKLKKRFAKYDRFDELFEDATFSDGLLSDLATVRHDLAALWNYCPHRHLRGRRPAERLVEELQVPRERRASAEELRYVTLPGDITLVPW